MIEWIDEWIAAANCSDLPESSLHILDELDTSEEVANWLDEVKADSELIGDYSA
jgi:hypothetical protein